MKRALTIPSVIGMTLCMLLGACASDSGGTKATGPNEVADTREGSLNSLPESATKGPNTPVPQPLAEKEKVTVAVAIKGAEAYAQVLLADHFGEFAKENLDADIQVVPHPETVGLLQSGRADVTPAGGNIAFLNGIASGADIAIVGAMPTFPSAPASKAGFWVQPSMLDEAGEVDPCSFEGKKIAFGGPVGFGSAATLPFANYIGECDLGLSDINLAVVGGPDSLLALENGSIDAAYLPDPLWADPDAEGYAEFAIPFGEDTVGGYMMGPLRHENPDVADAILRALVRTTRTYLQGDYRSDPTVRSALEEVLGIPSSVLDVGSSLIFDPDMRFDPVLLEPIQEMWLSAGDLLSYDEPLPAAEVVDQANLKRVLAAE